MAGPGSAGMRNQRLRLGVLRAVSRSLGPAWVGRGATPGISYSVWQTLWGWSPLGWDVISVAFLRPLTEVGDMSSWPCSVFCAAHKAAGQAWAARCASSLSTDAISSLNKYARQVFVV